jgi:hypothetical protein
MNRSDLVISAWFSLFGDLNDWSGVLTPLSHLERELERAHECYEDEGIVFWVGVKTPDGVPIVSTQPDKAASLLRMKYEAYDKATLDALVASGPDTPDHPWPATVEVVEYIGEMISLSLPVPDYMNE